MGTPMSSKDKAFFEDAMRAMQGCDGWMSDDTGARGWFCATAPAPYADEVTGEVFCAEHAGPLAWSDCKVNAYTIAVRVSGHLDVPLPDRWSEGEKAASVASETSTAANIATRGVA